MNYAHIFIASQVVILALCVLIPICKAIGRSAKEAREEREAEERQAEAERSAARKKAEAEAKAAEAERRRAIRKAEADAKRAERLEAARQLAGYKRQAVEAEKELRAMKKERATSSETLRVPPSPQGEGLREPAPAPVSAPAQRRPIIQGNNAFRGQCVAFTGTLKGWKRREAIQAVADNGGRAFEDMPAGTTILIVGDKPGKTKLDKARKWGVRILTETDFESYLTMPVTMTPNEFAALYAA